jgi:hypothetical protein
MSRSAPSSSPLNARRHQLVAVWKPCHVATSRTPGANISAMRADSARQRERAWTMVISWRRTA